MSANDFYDYQCAAKKFYFSLTPFWSLKTCLISQTEPLTTHYNNFSSELATTGDVRKKRTP
jgi:hypothetical protein